ncbi:MAG: hypothetical protein KAX44_00090 [Candidatus Brocadiae bacterium]|nr:hypothetical protein [Candidatus Brocadiia bacterium]
MKIRCRCGHELNVADLDQLATHRCIYCGRTYRLLRDAQGRLEARELGASQDRPPEATPGSEWPDELELDAPRQQPTAQDAASSAAPTGAVAQRMKPADEAPAAADELRPRRSWYYYLADSWGYPLRGSVKWTLLGWVFLAVFVMPFLCLLPLVGLLVPFMVLGLLILYEFALIRESAFDAEMAPSLPAWENVYESGFRPLGLLLAALLGSSIPFLLALGLAKFVGGTRLLPELVGAFTGEVSSPWGWVLVGGMLLSSFMIPMNMLAVAASDSAAGINPKFTFPAVLRIPGSYALCAVFCTFCCWGGARLGSRLARVMGGRFLGGFAGQAVWVYLITVACRALGTLHYAYSDKMGWMK